MLALEKFPKDHIMKPRLLTGFLFGHDFPLGEMGASSIYCCLNLENNHLRFSKGCDKLVEKCPGWAFFGLKASFKVAACLISLVLKLASNRT